MISVILLMTTVISAIFFTSQQHPGLRYIDFTHNNENSALAPANFKDKLKISPASLFVSIRPKTPDGGNVCFTIWKPAIFRKIKKIKPLCGGVAIYAAQSNALIDTEIAEKGGFRTETSVVSCVECRNIAL